MEASNYLKLIHADLCGPMNTKSFGASQYFLKLKYEIFDNF